MMMSGVLFGLAAAASQSGSYIFSKLYVIRRHSGVTGLLLTSHLIMGAAALVILPFVVDPAMPRLREFALPLGCAALFYLCGQVGLFLMIRRTDASRVAPLLGLKIVMLAAISTMFLDHSLNAGQWLAVLLCTGAALMLYSSGTRLALSTVGYLLLACTGYSLSDLSIERLVHALHPLPTLHAAMLGVCMSYILCAVLSLILVPFCRQRMHRSDWLYGLPFAAFWFLSMVFLFACFGTIGAIYGNILQSTRGLLSIVLGVLIARAGHVEIEQPMTRSLLVRRIAAATLMCLAIWLFQSAMRPA